MRHSFNTDVAERYGLQEAILLDWIVFWLAENERNERNFYEGRCWVFNSAKALAEKFHYLSPNTIQKTLKRLEDAGIIISGNFNKNKFDRTKWYSIADEYRYLLKEHRSDAENLKEDAKQNPQSEDASGVSQSASGFSQSASPFSQSANVYKLTNTPTEENSKEFQTDSSLSLANARTREANAQSEISQKRTDDFSQSNNFSPPVREPAKKFQKPTIEQIRAYCKEAGKNIDPEAFFDFYEAKGWVVGRAPMKDWKAAVRNWAKNESQFLRRKVGSDGQDDEYADVPMFASDNPILKNNFLSRDMSVIYDKATQIAIEDERLRSSPAQIEMKDRR